jgi:arsenate reductase
MFVAEFLGSALLTALVIGSGIAAHQLSPADSGLQLLENGAATAAGLFAIILMFGPVSGEHFNPVVSLVDAALGGAPWRQVFAYVPVQVAGCVAGAMLANVMFDLAPVSVSTTQRATAAHGVAEVVATVGLLLVIFSLMFSDTFAGIDPASVALFVAMQLLGGPVAVVLVRGLYPLAAPVTTHFDADPETVLGPDPTADMSSVRD